MIKLMLPAVITASLFLTACGGESNSTSGANAPGEQSANAEQTLGKNLNMNLNFAELQNAGVSADRVVVTVTKGEFNKESTVDLEDYSATIAFNNLIIGDYTIAIEVFDGDTVIAQGNGSAVISANQQTVVDINLTLNSGDLVVNINVENPEPQGSRSFSENLSLLTTSEIINGRELQGGGSLGTSIAPPAQYFNEAAYADLALGSNLNLEMNFDYEANESGGVFGTAYQVIAVDSEQNTLDLKLGEAALLNCAACDVELEYSADDNTFTATFLRLPVDAAERLVVLETGENIVDLNGQGPVLTRAHTADLSLVYTRTDGNPAAAADLSDGLIVDPTVYSVTANIKIATRATVSSTVSLLQFGYGDRDLILRADGSRVVSE